MRSSQDKKPPAKPKPKPVNNGKGPATKPVPQKGASARKLSGESKASKASEELQTKEAQIRREILRGNLSEECPANAKVVRIFTSSTFTDSSNERNALMSRVYPKLKAFCQSEGYEFQVVDMRWGVRDEATDNHMATELCLREVKLCQRLSTGPNFVTFLSHKYGYGAFPNLIEADEFEKISAQIDNDDDRALVNKWFKRDDNAVPPCYTFQAVSTHLPDFISTDEDKRQEAKNTWNEESTKVKESVIKAAEKVLKGKELDKYIISVTEAEIECGLLKSEDVNKHGVWFRRVISDIEQKESTPCLAKFIDCSENLEEQTKKRALLKELADKKLPSVLNEKQIHRYPINWTDDGVDPENNEAHKEYIDKLCEDFQTTLTEMITVGIEERKQHAITDDLYEEVLQHAKFAQSKCRSFHGREEMLEAIKSYVLGNSRSPFVVHGPSGSGKTSIVAKAAVMTKSWIESRGKGLVLLRFLGTTPDSTGIKPMLTSLLKQIMSIGKREEDIPEDLKDLIALFAKMLGALPSKAFVVIYLDSLDQLDPSNGAKQLSWLPKHLPAVVKIVVSTLPEPIYECFPRLQVMIKDPGQFTEVERLPEKDVSNILDSWLKLENRTLTNEQKTNILETFSQCPLPLFLKLSFDEACRWKSYDKPDDNVLQTTVRAAINCLFDRVEKLHGKLLVSRALALLTLSISGLSESELEDILSCDEEVLNDVYQYWLPPVRRLPPLLLVRLKADLSEYLVDRGADGVRVFYWYHRQFIETARDRYCTKEEENTKVHTLLADFFRGTWNGAIKSYTDKKGKDGEADRFVVAQPLRFGDKPNVRKLNNLPYHLIKSGSVDLLKRDVCLNMEFLLAKLKAVSLRSVLDDFEEANKMFNEDEDITLILEALRLSQDALLYDPNELPCQLLGRIPEEKENIFGDVTKISIQYLMPDTKILTPPGGQLIHCLAGHREAVNCIDITSDGKIAITASLDRSVRFWDVLRGKIIQSLENMVEDPERVHVCCQDKIAVVNSSSRVIGLRIPSGDTVYTVDNFEDSNKEMNFISCGKDRGKLVILGDRTVYILDSATGKTLSTITNSEPMVDETFSAYDPISAKGRYVATAVSGSAIIRVIDVKKAEFIHNKRVFPKPKTDDDDEFSVDSLVITNDKKNILYSNYMDNDIHICHLKSMARLRVLKGKKSDNSEKFHLSLDNKTLFFPNFLSVSFVDLETGDRTNHTKHPNNLVDVVSVNMTTLVTISSDSVVRIWDLTREDPLTKPKPAVTGNQQRAKSAKNTGRHGDKLKEPEDDDGAKENKFGFKLIKPLPKSRFVFVQNRSGDVQIFDLINKVNVRSATVTNKNLKWRIVDSKTAVILTNEDQLQLVDLDTMTAVRGFQGCLYKYGSDFGIRREAREIVTKTKNGKDIKMYNMDTGATVDIIKTNQNKVIDDILVSDNGKWLVMYIDDKALSIVDLDSRKIVASLPTTEIGTYPSLSESYFSPNGDLLLLNASLLHPKAEDLDEFHYLVIDLTSGKIVHRLLDVECALKYSKTDVDHSVSPGCAEYLRDNLFLVGSDDKIIRVWDFQTGELLHRLTGHSHDVTTLLASDDGSRFVSYSNYTEEEAFRLWDALSFTCLATFKADHDIERIDILSDGSRVIAGNVPQKTVMSWRLTGAGVQKEQVSGQEDFQGVMPSVTFKLAERQTFPEPDPDTVEADPSSDEDEADDDDDLDSDMKDLNFSDSDDDIGDGKMRMN